MGGNANDLTSLVADPNVSMHESKAFACRVRAGRLGGPALRPTGELPTASSWFSRPPLARLALRPLFSSAGQAA